MRLKTLSAAIAGALILPLTGCSTHPDEVSFPTATTTDGKAFDYYVRDALVIADLNRSDSANYQDSTGLKAGFNGTLEADEVYFYTFSDGSYKFNASFQNDAAAAFLDNPPTGLSNTYTGSDKTLKSYAMAQYDSVLDEKAFTGFLSHANPKECQLVLTGGYDVFNGSEYAGVMKAPCDSPVITPITTLTTALVDSGKDVAAAEALVAKVTGVSPEDQKKDPMTNENALKATQIVNQVTEQLAKVMTSDANGNEASTDKKKKVAPTAIQAFADYINDKTDASGNTTIDISVDKVKNDSTGLADVIKGVGEKMLDNAGASDAEKQSTQVSLTAVATKTAEASQNIAKATFVTVSEEDVKTGGDATKVQTLNNAFASVASVVNTGNTAVKQVIKANPLPEAVTQKVAAKAPEITVVVPTTTPGSTGGTGVGNTTFGQ